VNSSFREAQIARASDALIARGGGFVELPTLLPSSVVLELAGEGLRPRLYFSTAPDGSELCLRADLTIPAAFQYVDTSDYDNEPFAWACKGPVFRAPRNGEDRPPEFVQIGLERFGDPDTLGIDATIFLAAWGACEQAGVGPLFVRFCDGGLLPNILAKADLPEVWRAALIEHTSNPRVFLAMLAQASGKTPPRPLSALERQLVGLTFEAACGHVQQALIDGDLALVGERSLEDVTTRLLTRINRVLATPLSSAIAQSLFDLATFTHKGSNQATLDYVVDLAGHLDVDLTTWRVDWNTRLDAIQATSPNALQACQIEALSDEAFDYYDGMAFDIATSLDFTRPVATGGRYDRLIGEISNGRRHARAIGCVVRPDRFPKDVNGEC
jgi:ATP phosphoribosyltransferase regulatory subunit